MTEKKYTVRVGKTPFAMKADLPKKEPAMLSDWATTNTYEKSLENSTKGAFILHDGPPYANGHIHVGHALNKILKDILLRGHRFMGYNAPYIPGWDCHGLPIEWKIEEGYRKKGMSKDSVPIQQLREECRQYATQWVAVQKEDFKRLGIAADWDNSYETQSYESEAHIIEELGKFLLSGSLYRGLRPVLWSVVEKTALAEAEVEYKDHVSDTVYALFPIVQAPDADFIGAHCIIWTTTPWTLPANKALAYNESITYGLYRIDGVGESAHVKVGMKIVMATSLADAVFKAGNVTEYTCIKTQQGLKGIIAHHPLHAAGYTYSVPALPADFVTEQAGTGIVHIAPAHGEDDFMLAKHHNIHPTDSVNEDGSYHQSLPIMAGHHIYKANPIVIEALRTANMLWATNTITHSYPHSWRSKAPLIYRATAQWFISMDTHNLREKALKEIDAVTFLPPKGKARLKAMVETRPDWCISRQRAWGVPIAIFVHKETMEPLRDAAIMHTIVEAFKKDGADAWFKEDPMRFLPSQYNKEDYIAITDVLDVWFDSGCTHTFILKDGEQADYYLEGSDQHRGWFQSSLLESCGTKGYAPYKNILTHGFVLDGKGQKMSKSLGNTITPDEVIQEYGADILRLWVVRSDYTNDLRISKDILTQTAEEYRRIRNTLRFLLANITVPYSTTPPQSLPNIPHYVLNDVKEKAAAMMAAMHQGDMRGHYEILYKWCNEDLSALYFDIWKDSLYCDREESPYYQALQYVLNHVFETLVRYVAPILPFTAEEAYKARHGDTASVHTQKWYILDVPPLATETITAIQAIKTLRPDILKQIELLKANKNVGSSLEIAVTLPTQSNSMVAPIAKELLMVARVTEGDTLQVHPSVGAHKCPRCWKYQWDTNPHGLCDRCTEVEQHHGS